MSEYTDWLKERQEQLKREGFYKNLFMMTKKKEMEQRRVNINGIWTTVNVPDSLLKDIIETRVYTKDELNEAVRKAKSDLIKELYEAGIKNCECSEILDRARQKIHHSQKENGGKTNETISY